MHPLAISKRTLITAFGGATKLVDRLLHAARYQPELGWLVVVRQGAPGIECLIDTTSAEAAYKRICKGETPRRYRLNRKNEIMINETETKTVDTNLFMPSIYGWYKGQIILAELKLSRANLPMIHVRVEVEPGISYDGYIAFSEHPKARAAMKSFRNSLPKSENAAFPLLKDCVGQCVDVLIMPWIKEGRSRDGIADFAPVGYRE